MVTAQRISKNTSFFLTALVIQKLFSFIYFTFLARHLGTEAIGQYFFAISFASLFSVLMDLGLAPVLTREIAKGNQSEEKWFQQIFSLKILFSIITIVIAIILDNILFYSDIVRDLIYLSIFIILIDSFTLLFYAFIRGKQNLKYESRAVIIFQIIVLALGFSLMQYSDNVFLFITVLFIASLFNLIYSGIILRLKLKIKLRLKYNQDLIKRILKIALPFALAAIFAKVYAYIDTVFLKIFLGDNEVGIYSVAYKITFAFQFIPLAFVAALYPAFSHYYQNNREELKRILSKSFNYLLYISLPISLGIIALAPEIIAKVYTNQFSNTILPLQILIASLPFLFINFSLSSFLNATNRQRINTRNLGLIMIINIILNIVLIQSLGVLGAALASSISTFLLFSLNLKEVIKLTGKNLIKFKLILNSTLAAFLMFLSVYYLKNIIYWPLTILTGSLVYFMLMFFSKTLTKEDFYFIKKSLLSKE